MTGTKVDLSAYSPINDIQDFMERVTKLIDDIVNHWDELLIPSEFRDPLKKAWEELKPNIANLDLTDTQEMIDAGLSSQSPQLKLKLGIVDRVWMRFASFGAPWLDDLLDVINAVLKSIPGAEAIDELKNAIENLIKISRREA